MKSGLGVKGFLYADDAKVLTILGEMRRIDDADAMELKLVSDLYHTNRKIDETAQALMRTSEMELIFEIVFNGTLIGSSRANRSG